MDAGEHHDAQNHQAHTTESLASVSGLQATAMGSNYNDLDAAQSGAHIASSISADIADIELIQCSLALSTEFLSICAPNTSRQQ